MACCFRATARGYLSEASCCHGESLALGLDLHTVMRPQMRAAQRRCHNGLQVAFPGRLALARGYYAAMPHLVRTTRTPTRTRCMRRIQAINELLPNG